MDNCKVPTNIYIDLSKAFDTLNFDILLKKLEHYGINESAKRLIHSYLTDRLQFVEFNSYKSTYLPISTGVPQGLVLINTNRNTLQEMLDITYKVASRYRIKLGSQKSKVLTIGKPDNHKTLTIGNTELEETETYKYLGMTLNNKGTLQNHIEDIKERCT